jgi:hypothetical protein
MRIRSRVLETADLTRVAIEPSTMLCPGGLGHHPERVTPVSFTAVTPFG